MSVLKFPHETPPEGAEMIEVAKGIHWIRLPLPMKLDHVNIYALEDGDGWTVIDAGMNSRKGRALWEALMAGPLQGRPIKRVILTHHHPDHVGMAGWLQSEHGAELWTTRTAWLFARMLTLDVQEQWPEETLAFYRSAGMDSAFYEKRRAERPFNFSDVVAPMPLGFKRLDEGDTLQIGARAFTVRLGQGHAPDHITLWSDDVVIAGDQVIASISSNLGVYATEPEADPVGAWFESCERLRPFAEPHHLVLPGHKLPFTGLKTRLTQLINNHHSALERLKTHLVEPRTAAECFQPLFKRKIGDGEYGLALVEAVGHVNHLHQIGEVSRERRADGAFLWRSL
ncbi:MAG: MBL fold metallo-hydrolase [Rhodobacteraceae bacterium]|nr:MBL fold metallo-hydrolase [Paracoccaceae bacterium]